MSRKKNRQPAPPRGNGPKLPSKNRQAGDRPREHSTPNRNSRPAFDSARPIELSRRDSYFLFGRNSVEAALDNSERECLRLVGTEKSLTETKLPSARQKLTVETHENTAAIAASVPPGSPHQGILLEVRPLPGIDLEDLVPLGDQKNIILMLDQVTDPHNVGACLRSAAAFGARALITQDRNSPDENGVIARSAAGALEILPWLKVANLAQTLDTLRNLGYWHVGLDGNTEQSIRTLNLGDNIVIVMGSEGKGLRPLVRKNCDVIAKIPMNGKVESLNVSNAAAITLYELVK